MATYSDDSYGLATWFRVISCEMKETLSLYSIKKSRCTVDGKTLCRQTITLILIEILFFDSIIHLYT
jgi:hypothetical protein